MKGAVRRYIWGLLVRGIGEMVRPNRLYREDGDERKRGGDGDACGGHHTPIRPVGRRKQRGVSREYTGARNEKKAIVATKPPTGWQAASGTQVQAAGGIRVHGDRRRPHPEAITDVCADTTRLPCRLLWRCRRRAGGLEFRSGRLFVRLLRRVGDRFGRGGRIDVVFDAVDSLLKFNNSLAQRSPDLGKPLAEEQDGDDPDDQHFHGARGKPSK